MSVNSVSVGAEQPNTQQHNDNRAKRSMGKTRIISTAILRNQGSVSMEAPGFNNSVKLPSKRPFECMYGEYQTRRMHTLWNNSEQD